RLADDRARAAAVGALALDGEEAAPLQQRPPAAAGPAGAALAPLGGAGAAALAADLRPPDLQRPADPARRLGQVQLDLDADVAARRRPPPAVAEEGVEQFAQAAEDA